jgi:isocitrate lyase
MGGKVLVSMQEHIDRLAAARLQADIMGCETLLIARTDASSATFLDNNVDPRDHPFIAGCTNESLRPLNEELQEAVAMGKSTAGLQKSWLQKAKLMRYPDAVAQGIRQSTLNSSEKEKVLKDWLSQSTKISHQKARELAKKLGFSHIYWCWEKPRTREGFYPVIGGTDYCVARACAFAPYSDMIWMETATPDLQECKEFADGVHAKFKDTMLAYNLSPSFNWDGAKMNDEAISQFQIKLGKMGFVWHFITLAGFHTNALHIDSLAKEYSRRGVVAYVQDVQREERRLGVETLTHQKWSGAELLDTEMMTATAGTSSTASLEGATESQFASKL